MASPRYLWDAVKARFKDSRVGRYLSRKQMTTIRDTTATQAAKEFRALAEQAAKDVKAGVFDAEAFKTAFHASIRNLNASQYILGRGGLSAMTGEDFTALQAILADQKAFASNFAVDLATGTVSEAQAGARGELYASVIGYEQGQASAWGIALPEYPGQRCLGGSRCRCEWVIVDSVDGIEATWRTEANPCGVCAGNAVEYNPFVIAKANQQIGGSPVRLSLSKRVAA